jgi:hypothetical protein
MVRSQQVTIIHSSGIAAVDSGSTLVVQTSAISRSRE